MSRRVRARRVWMRTRNSAVVEEGAGGGDRTTARPAPHAGRHHHRQAAQRRARGHRATGSPLGRVLVDLGYATRARSSRSWQADRHRVHRLRRDATGRGRCCLVIRRNSPSATRSCRCRDHATTLLVAMADPQNVLALDDLRIITGYEIKPAISTKDDIIAAIEEYYRGRRAPRTSTCSSAQRTSPTTISPS